MEKKLWNSFEKVLRAMFEDVLKLRVSEKKWKEVLQIIKFGIVGLSNTVLGYIIYVVALKILEKLSFPQKADYIAAQCIMFFLTVLWSFYWNNKWVFKDTKGNGRNILLALFKSYCSYAMTSLILSALLLILWVDVLGVSKYIAPILTLLITIPLNFLIQKKWIFK